MYKLLVEHGANTNLKINEDEIFEINDRKQKKLKFARESSPLEYATKLQNLFHYDL